MVLCSTKIIYISEDFNFNNSSYHFKINIVDLFDFKKVNIKLLLFQNSESFLLFCPFISLFIFMSSNFFPLFFILSK